MEFWFMEYWTNPLFAKHLKSNRINPNISKYGEFGESKMLGLDTISNMTFKYGTDYFIIIRHYKLEDCEIDTDR